MRKIAKVTGGNRIRKKSNNGKKVLAFYGRIGYNNFRAEDRKIHFVNV